MDAFQKFAEHVRRTARKTVQEDPTRVHNSPRSIIVDILQETFAHPLREELEQGRLCLLDDAVYLVLNHTPLTRPDERDFVAIIVSDNVEPRTCEWMRQNSVSMVSVSGAQAPQIIAIQARSVDAGLKDVAQRLWLDRWKDYKELTDAAEKNGWTTWNQFVLRHCLNPVPIGIVWKAQERSSYADCYVAVDDRAATAIGLPSPCDEQWVRRLLELSPDAFRQPDGSHESFTLLQQGWKEMAPPGPLAETVLSSAAWAVFHLLRCYAIWGGSAFLSIPITIGVDGRDRTGVLSLCTKKPMSSEQVNRWELIANHIFDPLVGEDACQQMHKATQVESYVAGGHSIKVCVDATGWRNAYCELASASRRCTDEWLAGVLNRGAATCALFGFAHGLGALMRLRGILDDVRPERRKKLVGWLDDEAFSRWQAGEFTGTEGYRRILFLAAKAVSNARRLPVLLRARAGKEILTETLWSPGEPVDEELREFHRVRLPPFSPESDFAVILYTVAVEPLMNAANAVVNLGGAATHPLVAEVECPTNHTSEPFVLRVGNQALHPPDRDMPPTLHDLELFFSAIKLVKFEPEVHSGPVDNLYMRWIRLEIRPWNLAKLIRPPEE